MPRRSDLNQQSRPEDHALNGAHWGTKQANAITVRLLPPTPAGLEAGTGCVHYIVLHISLPLSLALSSDPCSKPHELESDLTESKLLLFPGGKNI
ncbi:hypothetical protein FJTKL_10786 [Diaporthe vaccinii]|uniref:Uncharacterized protein n=1 Tax=Diaporthe vaccinii TaxID=105482 RepID=A0ABR4FBR6_9PEZI